MGLLESTISYLGIEVDDALEMSEQTEVWVYRSRNQPRRAVACRSESDVLESGHWGKSSGI